MFWGQVLLSGAAEAVARQEYSIAAEPEVLLSYPSEDLECMERPVSFGRRVRRQHPSLPAAGADPHGRAEAAGSRGQYAVQEDD